MKKGIVGIFVCMLLVGTVALPVTGSIYINNGINGDKNIITQDNNIEDFDLAFAHEAVARASALAGNKKDYEKHFKLANEAGEKIKEKGDREYFFEDLNAGEW